MTQKDLAKLDKLDPARAVLARKMMTYLNHLAGWADRGGSPHECPALRFEEGYLATRFDGLPAFPDRQE